MLLAFYGCRSRTLAAVANAKDPYMTARRRFIAQGAALAALPFISARTMRAVAAASKPKLGFALCGLGDLSEHQIAPALLKTKRCKLTGVITSDDVISMLRAKL